MQIPLYHVDAFTDKVFSGNPAAVCILNDWLPDETLHAIAKENNLPVTAFLLRENNQYKIRWITPEYELDICGHGSLAASFVIFNFLEPTAKKIELHSQIEVLPVVREGDLITLNFPVKLAEKFESALVTKGLGASPSELYQFKNERCLAIFNSVDEIKKIKPDMEILKLLPHRGITVSAPGVDVDFVSRTFYPHKLISEDPATGASHCLLVPYWAERLNKTELHARQVSQRGGEMFCRLQSDRVLISSKAVLYLQGTMILN